MKTDNRLVRMLLTATSAALILGLVVGGVLLAPAPAVLAAPAAQTPEPPVLRDGKVMAYTLTRELLLLEGQQARIELMHEIGADMQTWIDYQKSLGKDTAALETALAAYNSLLDAAQAKWDEANRILTAKAGFDAAGQVVDPKQAAVTLRTAGQAQREVHRLLRAAGADLKRAVHEFRRLNGFVS